jgi:hypothetical protein
LAVVIGPLERILRAFVAAVRTVAEEPPAPDRLCVHCFSDLNLAAVFYEFSEPGFCGACDKPITRRESVAVEPGQFYSTAGRGRA